MAVLVLMETRVWVIEANGDEEQGSRMKGRWMIEANEVGSRMSGVGDRG